MMLRRFIAGLLVTATAMLSLVFAKPAYADAGTTVGTLGHYNGGILRSKLFDGTILWSSSGQVLVQWNMQDTSTDGYSAKVWVIATYTTYYGPNTLHPTTTVTRTDGTGNIVYKNSGWIARYQYCSSDAACSAGVYSYDTADSITVYIGRSAGDRTLIGTFANPLN